MNKQQIKKLIRKEVTTQLQKANKPEKLYKLYPGGAMDLVKESFDHLKKLRQEELSKH